MYDDCVKDYELEGVKDQVLELESALAELRREFESLNLMLEADHKSEAIIALDEGPFVKDSSDL